MMEEKVYKSNKISLDLINQLKIAEIELGYIYVPVKTDSIDVILAEVLTTRINKLVKVKSLNFSRIK